jgi:amino acid adenylation domain-containing protein
MTILEFSTRLLDLDVRLWVDDEGRLRYSAPPDVMTPDLRAELVERKEEIVTFLRSAGGIAYRDSPPILPVSREGNLPLSFAQQRLWFLDQLDPGNTAYNIFDALRLSGPLDVAMLERCFNEIIQRHEALRTTFAVVAGEPVQIIAPVLTVSLPVVDLQSLSEVEKKVEFRRLAVEETRWSFDLARGPLVQVTVLRLGEREHMLLSNMHHIVSDGWSMGVFIGEVVMLYQAYSAGETSPLAELPIQYADFAVWQRKWLQSEELERQLGHWKKALSGAPAALELATDRLRPPVQTYRGATESFILSERSSAALLALSRAEKSTLFMTLLAAFNVLLYRYTGQEDILVGSPIANRNRAEIEGLIGFFANTLVLRTELSGRPTFRGLLGRVRQMTMEAYAHQDLPFEMLIEKLHPERDLSRTPLFQVMFVFQNAPMPPQKQTELTFDLLEVDNETAKFDLTLSVIETQQGLSGKVSYNTDLFDAGTVRRLVNHLQALLEGIVADPDQRITDVPILTAAERRRLLVEWNGTETEYPREQCLHELFEAQVERTPDAMAVVFEEQHLTYRELNRRANHLAHHLRGQGVRPEVLVAVCMERALEMAVGLLGVFKAGGAYVPLDPTYPQERLSFTLEDAQVAVLLTQEHLVERLTAGEREIICLDADCEDIAPACSENPDSGVTPGNLAYVIYTSGSTGRPKGVLSTHRSLANYLHWFNESLPDDVHCLIATTPLTFDASLKQLFAPLLKGREVWILPSDVIVRPDALLQSLSTRSQVGFNCVPSLWRAVLDTIDSSGDVSATHITCLLVGGEVIGQETINRTLTKLPHLQVRNLYGPTEATANSSVAQITLGDEVTIGRPIANVQLYILDHYMRPVPIGAVGELCIAGAGLTRGYLNRPKLTAEVFIPNPFSKKAGARLYRTGDLVRYLPDGNVEFLGRIDRQVKVRGHRVELGEIEAVLRQHSMLQETAVLLWEDRPGDKRLVAYIVPNNGPESADGELRRFLHEKLPEYMVPSVFVTMESLPLTSNGKVNRRALPAPDGSRPKLETIYVSPRSEAERAIAAMWKEVLHIEQVGVNDNFFDLGGHSLSVVQVHGRLVETFKREFPMTEMFKYTTVSALAQYLGQAPEQANNIVQKTKERAAARRASLRQRVRDR